MSIATAYNKWVAFKEKVRKVTLAIIKPLAKLSKPAAIIAPLIALATQFPVIVTVVNTSPIRTTISNVFMMGIIAVVVGNVARIKDFIKHPSRFLLSGVGFGICVWLKTMLEPVTLVLGVMAAAAVVEGTLNKFYEKLAGIVGESK